MEDHMRQDRSVQPLRKITVMFRAGTTAAAMDMALPAHEIAFIFGIGSGGLTPLECLLNGRSEGEMISFRVAGSEGGVFFGHVAPSFGRLLEDREEVYFTVRILGVETPPPRDVIRAMADLAARDHGTGCDCGCGCG
jgi:hypothetical protein